MSREILRTSRKKAGNEVSAYFADASCPVISDNKQKLSEAASEESNLFGAKKRIDCNADLKKTTVNPTKIASLANSTRERDMEVEIELNSEEINDIEDAIFTPDKWKEVLSCIREMRGGQDAPVDSMGCDQCADADAPLPTQRLHHLLSLMLSSQTKDQVTYAAMARLRSIPGRLDLATLMALTDEELGRLIYPVSFWKSKVKYIKKAAQLLKENYDGDIPNTVEGLCSLPGVGPKMAHLCMQSAWGVVSGIGVDTHVHRISNRLGWVHNTKTPEKTRVELERWLPMQYWQEVNHLLVGFGQTVCKPVQPKCQQCSANKLCPSAGKKSAKKK